MTTSSKTYDDLDRLCDDASTACENGRFERARVLYLDALRTCSHLMDHDYRISIRQYLGVCCYRLGNFSEAARHDRETLHLLLTAPESGSGSKVVTLRHHLARDLSAVHDQDPSTGSSSLKEAIALHRTNLEMLNSSNSRREELLETKYSLAFDLAKLSKSSTDTVLKEKLLEEAAKLDWQVVQTREESSPKGSLTIQSRHNLASVLYNQGKYAEAKKLLLQNQQDLDSLSSAEKKQLVVLRQSTDRHLAACCEATKDISLSIARITTGNAKNHKPSQTSQSTPTLLDTAKLKDGSKDELSGKLWNLTVDNAGPVTKARAVPTGLVENLSPPQINVPIASGPQPSGSYSGIATGGSSRVHMGNVYATNVNYYYNSPAPNAEVNKGSLRQPASQIDSHTASVKKLSSHGQDYLTGVEPVQPPPTRPRSASIVRDDGLISKGPPNRSRSTSNLRPNSMTSDRNGGEHRSVVDKTSKPSLLQPDKPSRSRSLSNVRRAHAATDEAVKKVTPKAPAIIHKADQWFSDLREHTHALLHYNNESEIPQRRRVRVAVIDSGVDFPQAHSLRRSDIRTHQHRICRYKSFTGDGDERIDSDPSSHGTNCASILLQVAPHAELYIANVVKKSTGNPSPSSVSAALEWALEKEVDIISMSLGFDKLYEDISRQIDLARLKGILVFAAASNDGPNAPDWGVFPAWLSNVFCINSADSSGAQSWFNPKFTDEKLNFMFLGEEIGILDADGSPLPDVSRLTGTSFATPIAAGTAALVLDLVRMQNIEKEFPKIEPCLRTYEGMSAVFKKMSSPPTALGAEFYNVRPWRLLGKKGPPLSRVNEPNESRQWYTLLKVVECLAKFGDLDTGISAGC